MSKFTAQYFIDKFEAIPEENWCIGNYMDNKGGYCAYGHCGARLGVDDTEESRALQNILHDHVGEINDGLKKYGLDKLGTTPKQRILEALRRVMDGRSLWNE